LPFLNLSPLRKDIFSILKERIATDYSDYQLTRCVIEVKHVTQ